MEMAAKSFVLTDTGRSTDHRSFPQEFWIGEEVRDICITQCAFGGRGDGCDARRRKVRMERFIYPIRIPSLYHTTQQVTEA
jgi:hypothetical protein